MGLKAGEIGGRPACHESTTPAGAGVVGCRSPYFFLVVFFLGVVQVPQQSFIAALAVFFAAFFGAAFFGAAFFGAAFFGAAFFGAAFFGAAFFGAAFFVVLVFLVVAMIVISLFKNKPPCRRAWPDEFRSPSAEDVI